jgi:hypothetical protein
VKSSINSFTLLQNHSGLGGDIYALKRRTTHSAIATSTLASLIPSGTSMSEHKRKHDSTTDDDNQASLKQELVCKRMVTAEERMMVEEKLRPALGQISGDSFLDIWNRQQQLTMLPTMCPEKSRPVYGQPSGPSFTDPVCHRATSPLRDMIFIIAQEVRTYVQTLVLNRAVISILDAGVL